MLTRRQFISASAVVAGMAGVPVGSAIASAAISPLIASKVKRIRLISQKSDDSWHHPPMVWTPAECYRDHSPLLMHSSAATSERYYEDKKFTTIPPPKLMIPWHFPDSG